MRSQAIALLGEAEKGDFHTPYPLENLSELQQTLGAPPEGTSALYFAIKTLLLKNSILFIRIEEEGFGLRNYLTGVAALKKCSLLPTVRAIVLPGVSDREILATVEPLLWQPPRILITTESDLFDFLMT